VPCSRTLRLAANGESGDRTHDLAVEGRPSYPTELKPPFNGADGAGVSCVNLTGSLFYLLEFTLNNYF